MNPRSVNRRSVNRRSVNRCSVNRRGVNRRRVRAQRTYRLLVWLYPSAHRRAFGEQMLQTFADHYRDVIEDRRGGALRFWLAVLADTAISLRTEHAAELRARRRGAGGARLIATARSLLRTTLSMVSAMRDRGHVRVRRAVVDRQRTRMNRSTRVRRRPRLRRSAFRPVRVVVRIRHHQLVYRGRLAALPVLVMLAGVALGVGAATALRLPKITSALLDAGFTHMAGSWKSRYVPVSGIADDRCAMMVCHAATTGLPWGGERVRAAAPVDLHRRGYRQAQVLPMVIRKNFSTS
jgi:hypothetical protein